MDFFGDKYLMYGSHVERDWKYWGKQLIGAVLSRGNKLLMNLYHPANIGGRRYQVAVCAIFKNEAPYFREWLEFHRLVGIEHFYLYNNFSEDNYQQVLQPYIDEGLVTLIDWPRQQAQMAAYQDCLEKFHQDMQWLGFIDLDEFVVPNSRHTVGEILAPFTKNRASVLLYWQLFGTSGRMERESCGLVTEDFIVCWPKFYRAGKCFLNMNYNFLSSAGRNSMLHHHPVGKYGFLRCYPANVNDNVSCYEYDKLDSAEVSMQINHYFTKSYQEYVAKKSKGDVYFKDNPHDTAYFFAHEMNCQAVDYTAYKYLVKLKLAMESKQRGQES